MEISIYSTIDFSKARNLLTDRQKKIKAFNPIVPQGGCISILENNPQQYISILWVFINQKTGKITSTTAQSSDSMHYVAIPENLSFGTYVLKITTKRTIVNGVVQKVVTSNPFEYVKASSDVVTIVSRNADNNLVGNLQKNATIIQPIYVNPPSGGGGGGTSFWEVEDTINIKPINGKKIKYETISNPPSIPTGGGGGFIQQVLTDAATISWDFSNGNLGTITIAGDRFFENPTDLVANQFLVIEITQGAGGSHLATFDTYFTFSGGIVPILSSVEGQTDRLWFLIRSATEISFHSAEFNI